jgi:hypothetical protein
MSSQPSNFRRTDIRRALQVMQTAGLKSVTSNCGEAKSALSPPNDEDDRGDDDSNNDPRALTCADVLVGGSTLSQ